MKTPHKDNYKDYCTTDKHWLDKDNKDRGATIDPNIGIREGEGDTKSSFFTNSYIYFLYFTKFLYTQNKPLEWICQKYFIKVTPPIYHLINVNKLNTTFIG